MNVTNAKIIDFNYNIETRFTRDTREIKANGVRKGNTRFLKVNNATTESRSAYKIITETDCKNVKSYRRQTHSKPKP